jgi:nitrite reductase/ring-hydroxylating ferredoxin subunit
MSTLRTIHGPEAESLPLSGWFAVARSGDLAAGESTVRVVLGKRFLLYRTASGEARVSDAVCPHQGGQLEHGRVRGDQIVCPIHHFAFSADARVAADGRCKRELRFYPVREQHGIIIAFLGGPADGAPWEAPRFVEEGWSEPRFHEWNDVHAHLNVALEEGSDSLHLATVHSGTGECKLIDYQAAGERAVLRAIFSVREWFGGFGRRHLTLHETLSYFGAGIVRNHFTCDELGIEFSVFVCITPKDRIDRLAVRLGVSLRRPDSFARVHPALGMIAKLSSRLAFHILGRFLLARSIRFFEQDLVYWSRKNWVDDADVHLDPEADSGPFFEHRAWIRQLWRNGTGKTNKLLPVNQDASAVASA